MRNLKLENNNQHRFAPNILCHFPSDQIPSLCISRFLSARTKLDVVLGGIGTYHAAIVAKVDVELVASKPKKKKQVSS